jgi:hypothetical protein
LKFVMTFLRSVRNDFLSMIIPTQITQINTHVNKKN